MSEFSVIPCIISICVMGFSMVFTTKQNIKTVQSLTDEVSDLLCHNVRLTVEKAYAESLLRRHTQSSPIVKISPFDSAAIDNLLVHMYSKKPFVKRDITIYCSDDKVEFRNFILDTALGVFPVEYSSDVPNGFLRLKMNHNEVYFYLGDKGLSGI